MLTATLFLACMCITIHAYRGAGRAVACILGGETGMCPEQMDPFADKITKKMVLPNKIFRFTTGKTYDKLYSLSNMCFR